MKNVTLTKNYLNKKYLMDAFFGRVVLCSGPIFLETKSRLLGAVFVSKSTGCFTMKQVTYPEELLLGNVQFSLQKKVAITYEKTHGL